MSDLTEFLLARIAEDEAAAREAMHASSYGDTEHGFAEALELVESEGGAREAIRHIARWDPARALAECEAKRRIVEQLWDYVASPDPSSSDPSGTQALWIVKMLALPYADHPDYRPEWRP